LFFFFLSQKEKYIKKERDTETGGGGDIKPNPGKTQNGDTSL